MKNKGLVSFTVYRLCTQGCVRVSGVEILLFGVYKNALRLREVHMIDWTVLITFLDRRKNDNS